MTRYQTGTRESVLRFMAECAIRDQEGLIEAYKPPSWQPVTTEAQKVIDDCRRHISDFQRIAGIKPVRPAA